MLDVYRNAPTECPADFCCCQKHLCYVNSFVGVLDWGTGSDLEMVSSYLDEFNKMNFPRGTINELYVVLSLSYSSHYVSFLVIYCSYCVQLHTCNPHTPRQLLYLHYTIKF